MYVLMYSLKNYHSILFKIQMYTGWSKKKCLRNSKIFFDGVFPSIYSHLKKLELSKLCRKKSYGALKILKMAC